MTFTEAAVEVLRLIGKPLHYKRITEIAIERNLLSHVGKTPEITMSSRLATMVKKDRGDAPIIKVKPGIFGLRDFPEDVLQAVDLDLAAEPEAGGAVELVEPTEAPEEAVAESPEEAPSKPARLERKIPGTEVFPEEEDDDEPILAKLDEESAERDEESGKKRKRRRRRRRGDETEAAEVSEGDRELREHPRNGERDREHRGRGREHREHRGRGGREERRAAELPGDWHREPADGDLVGKELSDAIAGALEAIGGQRPRPLSRVAEELVRRGRLAGDPVSLVPTLAASARGDDAKRASGNRKPRFRIVGDEISLLDWALPNDASRIEREVEQAARKQREFVRRAFVRRVSELPTAGFMELLATWLNVMGVAALRGIRRPGASPGELHLAGVLKQGPLETPIAIVILREGASVSREKVVEIRGALHHYGSASAAWLITLGQVLSGAREEAQASGAAPCALFDGQELSRSMEDAGVGLRTYVVPVVGLDLDLLDALRGPGARPAQQAPLPRREPEPEVGVPEAVAEEDSADEPSAAAGAESEGEGEAAANGRRRRRRRRRRGGAADEGARPEGAAAGAASEQPEEAAFEAADEALEHGGFSEGADEPEPARAVLAGAELLDEEGGKEPAAELVHEESSREEEPSEGLVDEERVSEPGEVPEDFEPVTRAREEEEGELDAFDRDEYDDEPESAEEE